ncbi:MAG: BrnA antitoxin family protein [Lachnospiraceae bacterium]
MTNTRNLQKLNWLSSNVSPKNGLQQTKQTVTIRLSPQALKKARSLGKGYTSVLSRILENALNDPNTIKHYL